jgi:hypothetical protein
LSERFWKRVDRSAGPHGCWPWISYVDKDGYGQSKFIQNGRLLRAHRLAYELTCGLFFDALQVLHTCDNPPCCNPAHLFLGTHVDNIRDAQMKGRKPFGLRHGRTKLTASQVQEIRLLKGQQFGRAVARRYGVTYGTIYSIWRGKNWRHLLPLTENKSA